MSLSHADGAVDVHIEDPLSGANTSMRTLLPGLSYHILYWEGPGPPQVEAPPPRFPLSVPLQTPAAAPAALLGFLPVAMAAAVSWGAA